MDRISSSQFSGFWPRKSSNCSKDYFSCDIVSFLLGLEVHLYINVEFVCVLLLEIQVVENVDWVRLVSAHLRWHSLATGHVGNTDSKKLST